MTVGGGQRRSPPVDVERAIHGTALREMLTNSDWVRRRVEQITFKDDSSTRRRVSVDFELPRWYAREERVSTWLAPLALLKKKPLVSFDLRDEEGSVLPLLGSDRNQLIVTAALITTAVTVLEKRRLSLHGEVRRDLEALAGCSLDEADQAIRGLFEGRYRQRERRSLRHDHLMRTFAEDMAVNFPLLVRIREPGERRVIKFSYLEELPHTSRSLTRTMGWSNSKFVFPLGGAGMAHSYHCEIGAPAELEIQQAELISFAGPQKVRVSHDDAHSCGEWVHLRAAEVRPDSAAVLISHLRAPLAGMPTSSALVALGVSTLLTFGAIFHQHIADSAEAATAILLTLPAGIAAYLGRPAHQLSRRLLRGIRVLDWVIAVLVFLAAAAMMLSRKEDRGDLILATWAGLAAVAWLTTLMLGMSAVLPHLRRAPRTLDPSE